MVFLIISKVTFLILHHFNDVLYINIRTAYDEISKPDCNYVNLFFSFENIKFATHKLKNGKAPQF